jgi:sec-independent protein translocase protein TatC
MFRYLIESLPSDIAMMPSLDEHFSFTLKMLLAFGVVFETPVFIFVLSLAGIIDPHKLGAYRRYVVLIAFIVGAVLTPTPDFLTQFLLAGPLIFLYELGVLVSRLAVTMGGTPLERRRRK